MLIGVSFLTSTLAGIIGMAGGLLLVSVMAAFLPPAAIVPLHGVVQLISNATRALFGFQYIEWRIFGHYFFGGMIGAAVGSQFITRIPPELIPFLLGCFILIVTWMPSVPLEARIPFKFFIIGSIQTFISLFVGPPGPLHLLFLLREGLGRDRLVVTGASIITGLHFLKVVTFGLIGFVFAPYIGLLAGMMISVTLGSYVGSRLRGIVPERPFRLLCKILLTLLALRMLFKVILHYT